MDPNNLIVERSAATTETKKRVGLPKFIFGILGLVIVIELIVGVRQLMSPLPVIGQKLPSFVPGQIALVADKSSYGIGDTANVDIRVSTGGYNTVGTDAYIKYDPSIVEASASAFARGSMYPDYPIVNIDNQKGEIKISGVDSQGNGFNGNGVFGTVSFQAKKAGKASLIVEYQPGSSVFSNIVESKDAKDILGAFYGTDLNISSSSNSSTAPTCQPRVLQLCEDSKGVQGTYWCSSIQNPYSCDVGCYMQQDTDTKGCRIVTNAAKK